MSRKNGHEFIRRLRWTAHSLGLHPPLEAEVSLWRLQWLYDQIFCAPSPLVNKGSTLISMGRGNNRLRVRPGATSNGSIVEFTDKDGKRAKSTVFRLPPGYKRL